MTDTATQADVPPAETAPANQVAVRPFKPRRVAFWVALALFLLWLGALGAMTLIA